MGFPAARGLAMSGWAGRTRHSASAKMHGRTCSMRSMIWPRAQARASSSAAGRERRSNICFSKPPTCPTRTHMNNLAHRVFSFRRMGAIAGSTLMGLSRLKIFYVLLLFALLLIGSSVFMAQMTFQQEFQVLKDIALGAMSIFTSLLAVIATARLLPQDIEDRTAYTVLSKPVSRFEYLAGKLLGVLLLLALSLLAMSALFFAV